MKREIANDEREAMPNLSLCTMPYAFQNEGRGGGEQGSRSRFSTAQYAVRSWQFCSARRLILSYSPTVHWSCNPVYPVKTSLMIFFSKGFNQHEGLNSGMCFSLGGAETQCSMHE